MIDVENGEGEHFLVTAKAAELLGQAFVVGEAAADSGQRVPHELLAVLLQPLLKLLRLLLHALDALAQFFVASLRLGEAYRVVVGELRDRGLYPVQGLADGLLQPIDV